MTRYAVTGGAGFIGSNIVAALIERGDDVVVLDDLSSGFAENLGDLDVTFVEASVLDRAAVDKAVHGCSVVFHLAASVGNKRSIDDPIHDAEVNVLGTINVLEACRDAGVSRLVQSSSAGIFGELKQLPIAEDHPLEPDSPYGASKLGAEKVALAYARLYELEVAALRYFNVYGRNQRFDEYGNVIPIFVFQMLGGEPVTIYGDGEQTRDFVEVRDVVQANLRAANATGTSGAFNVASGTKITINELANLIAKEVGGDPEIVHGPPRPGDVRHSLADISAAQSAFGFVPQVGLAEGLRDYVAWARGVAG
jgi:nucleoside-diphosphate-sugar epimerase